MKFEQSHRTFHIQDDVRMWSKIQQMLDNEHLQRASPDSESVPLPTFANSSRSLEKFNPITDAITKSETAESRNHDVKSSPPEDGATTAARQSAAGHRRKSNQLLIAQHLKDLDREDPACLMHVNRIHLLGFNSEQALTRYFQQYGDVVKVLLSNSMVHDSMAYRMQPSRKGFVVMATPEGVAAALKDGVAHDVEGNAIYVRQYYKRGTRELFRESTSDEHNANIDQVDSLQTPEPIESLPSSFANIFRSTIRGNMSQIVEEHDVEEASVHKDIELYGQKDQLVCVAGDFNVAKAGNPDIVHLFL